MKTVLDWAICDIWGVAHRSDHDVGHFDQNQQQNSEPYEYCCTTGIFLS